jgi:ABC-type transport system substrate-binding protein
MDPVMFDELILHVIDDSTTRNYVMLGCDIDYLFGSMSDLWDTFKESPYITFKELDKPSLSYSYLGMNNKQINVTWRKAISYAINYTYILEDMWEGSMAKSHGPVSPGFGLYFDDSLKTKAPYYNLTIARQTLIDDLGINTTGLTASINPHDAAWESANLTIFNYTYNTDNLFRADLYVVLKEWLLDIGIVLEDGGTDWAYFLYRYWWRHYPDFDEYQLFWRGWSPDYLDPMNIIKPLFSNTSIFSNAAQVNDPILEKMITDYLSETLEPVRITIIKNISEYLATELYPHVFGYHTKTRSVHAADLYDVAYNVAGAFWAYPIKRNLTWSPSRL